MLANGGRRPLKKLLKIAAVVVVLLSASVLLAYNFTCPCAVIPGRALSGDLNTDPVIDWSFANDVPLCQLEVRPQQPHSINLNCMSAERRLFVSCSVCESKGWSAIALEIPQGRIRVDGIVYPVTMRRLTLDSELDLSWQARSAKLDVDPGAPRPDDWWSFEMITI